MLRARHMWVQFHVEYFVLKANQSHLQLLNPNIINLLCYRRWRGRSMKQQVEQEVKIKDFKARLQRKLDSDCLVELI